MATTETKKVPKIRGVYDPKGEEAEVLKMVYLRKTQMEQGTDRSDASKSWDRWMKQWDSWREKKNSDDWQSNHVVPLTFSVIEAALAEMVDNNSRPIILPRGSEDAPKATVTKHIFNYTWEVADGDNAVYDVNKDSLILGTAIGQEYYLKRPRTIRNIKMVNEDGKDKETYTEEETFDYDDCMLEPVRLQDFYVDETATDFTGPRAARDCIRRYIMDMDSFKNFFKGDVWNPLDNVKRVQPGGDTEYYEWYKPPQGIDMSNQVEVLWYWSILPKDYLVIVANDVVVRFGPNIYKHKQLPFAKAVDVKKPHRFYGKGECEILESVQDEKDVLRRMAIDRNHLDIDKMFIVSDRLTLNDDDLIARPHGAIPASDINSVKAVEYNDIPRSVEMSMNQLDEDGIIATGIDPRLSSMPQAGTATQAAFMKESMLKRIRMKLRLMERSFLTRVARLRVSNIIQFYSQPKLEKIVGEAGTQEYKNQMTKWQNQGLLVQMDGETYKKTYRNVRIKDKELDIDAAGNVVENPMKGYSFFEAKPEFFVPTAQGGFDIKFTAGATLPISEPLMQTKAAEMYDRLIQLAAAGVGYDPVKLGDMLLDVNNFDPQDYHLEEQPGAEQGGERLQMVLAMAMDENKMMLKGQPVPPTAFAPPAHTQIHIEFMKSKSVPSDKALLQVFTDHVTGELLAQGQRSGGAPAQGMPGAEGAPPTMGNSPQTAVQSGEEQRRAISPGKAPGAPSLQDMLPGLITGSRTMPTQA